MIPPAFEYLRPKTIPEALAFLQHHGENAKILSGGQSLIPMMKLRLARPGYIVDLNRIAGLAYIKEDGGMLKIGGLTREAELESSALVRSKYPLLLDTAKVIADPQVRNLATVGGNLAHGDPANDHPATMIALGAQIVATGSKGERVIPVETFFVSLFTTALEQGEILTEIRIPIPPAKSGGAYFKVERKVGDFATAAVAAQLTLDAESGLRADQRRCDAGEGKESGRLSARQEAGRSHHRAGGTTRRRRGATQLRPPWSGAIQERPGQRIGQTSDLAGGRAGRQIAAPHICERNHDGEKRTG
jgi:carbon-monoxide dehydrogenase medium subunit